MEKTRTATSFRVLKYEKTISNYQRLPEEKGSPKNNGGSIRRLTQTIYITMIYKTCLAFAHVALHLLSFLFLLLLAKFHFPEVSSKCEGRQPQTTFVLLFALLLCSSSVCVQHSYYVCTVHKTPPNLCPHLPSSSSFA